MTTTVTNPADLRLLRKDQPDTTGILPGGMFTPAIDEDYWAYCVPLSEGQAIVGFPKFNTVGIGFAVEEDWNSNLPYQYATDKILLHIWQNRGHVTDSALVRRAIEMVQDAVYADLGGDPMSQDWEVPEYMIPGRPGNQEED
jgi:hypothetical protein